MSKIALLALEDGKVFYGYSFGALGSCVGEVVFNTSMTGYQEIVTDPSYKNQIVSLTYPHIGNTGCNTADNESDKIHLSGFIIRDLPVLSSSWREEFSLDSFLKKQKTIGLYGIDTRALTKHLRNHGSLKGCIMSGSNLNQELAIKKAIEFEGIKSKDLAKEVSTSKKYIFNEGSISLNKNESNKVKTKHHVVVYDFGVKKNILRLLVDHGCTLTVVNAKTPAKEVMELKPDGVFLSNGPGDPEPCDYAVENIKKILEVNIPIFGICLGHQLLSIASGAKTEKMKFGHHGANHPVKDLGSKEVMITSQNHGFAVSDNNLPSSLRVTHRSLFDNSIQGIEIENKKAFSFQGHPEASPGPHDVDYLFDKFCGFM